MRGGTRLLAFAMVAVALAGPLAAQLQVPGVPVHVPPMGEVLGEVGGQLDQTVGEARALTGREARRLLRLREQTLGRLLRANPQAIERDAAGNLARRGELLATGASEAELRLMEQAGFRVMAREQIEHLVFEALGQRSTPFCG